MDNPDLNKVLNTDNELFKHAWLQIPNLKSGLCVIACEPYDRELSREEAKILFGLIRKNEKKILNYANKIFNTNYDYVEIENYLFL